MHPAIPYWLRPGFRPRQGEQKHQGKQQADDNAAQEIREGIEHLILPQGCAAARLADGPRATMKV
jgi:hypothetical protein